MSQSVSEMVEYETRGDVGIWQIEDMVEALDSGDLEDAEDHFLDVASDPSMNSVVIGVGNAEGMPKDVLSHVNDKWTELGEETDLDATAYVSDGLSRLAISQKNEAEGMKTKGFKSLDDAVEWAQEF